MAAYTGPITIYYGDEIGAKSNITSSSDNAGRTMGNYISYQFLLVLMEKLSDIKLHFVDKAFVCGKIEKIDRKNQHLLLSVFVKGRN